MFQDALQSLLDWLSAVEPSLSTETAVMGDPETVQILIDNHKVKEATWISNKREPRLKADSIQTRTFPMIDLYILLIFWERSRQEVFWTDF